MASSKVFSPIKKPKTLKGILEMDDTIEGTTIPNTQNYNLVIYIGWFKNWDSLNCLLENCGSEKFNLLIIASDSDEHNGLHSIMPIIRRPEFQLKYPNLNAVIHFAYDLPPTEQSHENNYEIINKLLNSGFTDNKTNISKNSEIIEKAPFQLAQLPESIRIIYNICIKIFNNDHKVCLVNGYYFDEVSAYISTKNGNKAISPIRYTGNAYFSKCVYMITFIDALKKAGENKFSFSVGKEQCVDKSDLLLKMIKKCSIYNKEASAKVLSDLEQKQGGRKKRKRKKTHKRKKRRKGGKTAKEHGKTAKEHGKTAKEHWKPGKFLGKTWWMPRKFKFASWLRDTMDYGIPI